jgi:transcriptional regulator with XRE-family HTH domain
MATRAPRSTPVRSVYRTEQQVVVDVLRSMREAAGLTQVGLAEILGRTQSYVSGAERGAKMDALQIRDWCQACGTDLVAWAKAIEAALKGAPE